MMLIFKIAVALALLQALLTPDFAPMLLLLPAVYDLDQSIAFKHECCQS